MGTLTGHSKWFWTRINVVALGALSGVSVIFQAMGESSDIGWLDCLVVFLAVAFGLLPIIGIQAINPRSALHWRKPSWEINPFLLPEPLQFFHCGAYYFLAAGIAASVVLACKEGVFPAPNVGVLLLSAGAGLRLGVQLSLCVFRHKIV